MLLRIAWWTLLYKVSAIDVNSAVPKLLSYTEHQSSSRLMAEAYEWFEAMLKAHIAPRAVERLSEALAEVNRTGVTILLVEQDVFTAFDVSSHAFVVETGRVTLAGPVAELQENPRVQQAYLGL